MAKFTFNANVEIEIEAYSIEHAEKVLWEKLLNNEPITISYIDEETIETVDNRENC